MKKVPVYDAEGKKVREIVLPEIFSYPYRQDLIKRAFLSFMSHIRQSYGSDEMAGKRTSASYGGRRRAYGSWINRGLHRTKRIRFGSGHMTGVVRFVPQAVKGRKAHPPKAEKSWYQKINVKERIKALISAIATTSKEEFVKRRGHRVDGLVLPIVLDGKVDNISKTSEFEELLKKIGLSEELERAKVKKVRAGKGKMRGRKYKKKVGPLIVTANRESGLFKAASNIAGVDVVYYDNLNIKQLSPSGKYVRLVIFTEEALKKINEKYKDYVY